MAGHSRRFKEAGHNSPKFSLQCGTKKMIEHVLDMFSDSDHFHFILNNNLQSEENLTSFLSQLAPSTSIYYIEPHELGPTYTIMEADLNIQDDSEIII